MEFDLGQVVGADGKGIVSIELISTSGKNKTYRITFTDETYFDYTVKDGDDAISAIVTSWEQTLSDNKVPSEKLTKNTLDTKVDKVTGKGLSTEDYTTAEKTKLTGVEEEANKTIVDSALSSTSTNPVQNKTIYTALDTKVDKVTGKSLSTNDYTDAEKTKLSGIETGANKTTVDNSLSGSSENPVQNKIVKTNLDNKANSSDLATVATSGSYNDLTDKPTIPPSITIDSSLSTTSENPVQNKVITGALGDKVDKVTGKGLSTEDYSTSEKTKLAGIEDGANKITVDDDLSSTSMNPLTNRRTYRWLTLKADKSSLSTVATSGDYTDLTNKPNLSTVATTGDYDDLTNKPFIPPGVIVDQTLDGSSTDAVANQAVVGGLNGKSDTGHSHTWTTQSLGSYGTLYVNETLRLVIFYYSRSYNYTAASDTTLETNIIPTAYQPSKSIPCASANPYIAGRVTSAGSLMVVPTRTGMIGTTLQAMWTY